MASCRRVEIWKTQSSSQQPTRLDAAVTDAKSIRIHAGDLCRLKALPCQKDVSGLPSCLERPRLRDAPEQRPPEVALLDARASEEMPTSDDGGAVRRTVANVYVDGPAAGASAAATGTDCGDGEGATRGRRSDDVKTAAECSARHDGIAGARCSTAAECRIICPRCGRCRCERCGGGAGGRELPGVWCGPRCGHCTPSRLVDVASCVCCVRAVDYHCSGAPDDDDVRKTDHPHHSDVEDDDLDPCPCSCSGSPSRCRRRWACLAALGGLGCLPCLLLYWPLRGLVALARAAYNAAGRRRGCRCGQSANRRTARRRRRLLLADTEISST